MPLIKPNIHSRRIFRLFGFEVHVRVQPLSVPPWATDDTKQPEYQVTIQKGDVTYTTTAWGSAMDAEDHAYHRYKKMASCVIKDLYQCWTEPQYIRDISKGVAWREAQVEAAVSKAAEFGEDLVKLRQWVLDKEWMYKDD